MSFPRLLLVLAAGLSLVADGAQAQARRHYVDPPQEIPPRPLPAIPDVDTTGSVRSAPPVVTDPRLAVPLPRGLPWSGCTTTTYMVGETLDHQVRVHRCW